MSVYRKLYLRLFPERQLFIRQNGGVRYLTLTGPVQLLICLGMLGGVLWSLFASEQYFSLQQRIGQSDEALQHSEQAYRQLSSAFRDKEQALTRQIGELQRQQQLLVELRESMPASLLGAASLDAPVATDAPVAAERALLPAMDKLMAQAAALSRSQSQQLDDLSRRLGARQQQLESVLAQANIDVRQLLLYHGQSSPARGGPVNPVPEAGRDGAGREVVDQLVALHALEAAAAQIPLSLPVREYYISSLYGFRTDPIHKRRAMHKGIDMAGWTKTKIYAPAAGVVTRAGRNGGYGKFIEIDHQNGFSTRYGHLHKIEVEVGQQLAKDQVIGLMGSTGRSTSTHLHYEVLFAQQTLNPLKLIKALTHVL